LPSIVCFTHFGNLNVSRSLLLPKGNFQKTGKKFLAEKQKESKKKAALNKKKAKKALPSDRKRNLFLRNGSKSGHYL